MWLVAGVQLQYFGNVAVLEVFESYGQIFKNFKHLLNNLVWRVAAIGILQQPFFEELAAPKFKEVALNWLFQEQLSDLWQQREPVHRLARSPLSLHDFADGVVVLVVGVGHLYKQLSC